MYLGRKLRLYPTFEQEQLFFKFAGAARWVWNECLTFKEDSYSNGVQIFAKDCRQYIKELKYTNEYEWLQEIPWSVVKKSIDDL